MHTPMIRVTPRNAGSSDENNICRLMMSGRMDESVSDCFFDDICNIKLYYYGKRWKRKKTT